MSTALGFLLNHVTMVQAALFGTFIVGCWTLENALLDAEVRRKKGRARVNALFVLSALPIQVGMTTICMALAIWVTTQHWGLLYLIPGYDSPWIKYGLMFIALDLLDYVFHVAMHHVPLFWRFHLVHHTDQAIDVSTTVREHPGETFIRNGFLIAWVFLCGASLEILVLRQTAETVANILAHTSFRLETRAMRMLGWLLVTPNIHHTHHHSRLPYTNRNYGDVLSVWDRLFGTFADLAPADTVFGLDTHASTKGDDPYIRALAMPFDEPWRSTFLRH